MNCTDGVISCHPPVLDQPVVTAGPRGPYCDGERPRAAEWGGEPSGHPLDPP
ncbi:hypothetical protein FM103_09760 [Corynebacterium xerosis]|nr:hypothetical protein FM103_09760 [Corynebacterium xerosis]